jgi:hypothetical protein
VSNTTFLRLYAAFATFCVGVACLVVSLLLHETGFPRQRQRLWAYVGGAWIVLALGWVVDALVQG